MRYQHTVIAVLVVLLLPFGGEASGDDMPLSNAAPVVLMVRVGESQADRELESRFLTELELYIEGISIQETSAPSAGFVEASLNRQIEAIKPIMVSQNAIAAMWLHAASPELLLLQVVVLDTGRALVRLFEHSRKEGSAEALAATAAELLGTAYLFEQEKSKQSKPIKKLVETTREQAKVPVDQVSTWRLQLAVHGQAGFGDGVGPILGIGGQVGGDRAFGDKFFLFLGVGGLASPLGPKEDTTMGGYEVHLNISAYFGPRLGSVRFGPVLTFAGGPAGIRVKRSGFVSEDYNYWVVNGGLGLQLRAPLHKKVSLTIASGISASPVRLTIKLRSNDKPVYRRGIFTGWLTFGVLLF